MNNQRRILDHVNTFIAVDKYIRHNRENSQLPLQMQLCKKGKTFCNFFIAFLESTLNFEHFQKKKNELHSLRTLFFLKESINFV